MDRELIAEHSDGIIATTGCPSGEVQTRLRLGQADEALQAASDYQDIFGAENFFLELMDHGLTIERRVRDGLLEIGKKLDLPPLATNDSHYVTKDQADTHAALLCVQSGKTLTDPNRFKFDGDGYYLKSSAEMRRVLGRRGARRGRHTLLIAERVESYDEHLRASRTGCRRSRCPRARPGAAGSARRSGAACTGGSRTGSPRRATSSASTSSSSVIIDKGFPAYFLVVADLMQLRPQAWASGSVPAVVRPPARCVAYALRHHRTSTRSRTACCSSGS